MGATKGSTNAPAEQPGVPTPDELPSMLVTSQVARRLNVSDGHVRKLVRRGELVGYRYGGTLRFRESDVMAWYDKHIAPITCGGR